ncbi:GMC family oxidoreductase [Ornithinibacillus californiensis]|uniref:GMC family oxidoreductase n=1 Tax=Ornithinibacillus californiensis TaxID=161536 RepID=UPI00064D7E8A|nr:GMC family oxidoreductase N-terminal domain-containing protein [Ornithinibacillus californiensis]
MKTKADFDYIVIGSGASGSTLASRLSEDPNTSVLVLESGGSDKDPIISIPKGFYFIMGTTKHSFNYPTLPVGQAQKKEMWQRGRVLGGSTSINGLNYERGSSSYWDRVAALGNDGWGWSDMVTAFKSFENHQFGASETRGAGGPLDIHVNREPDELNDAIFAAAEKWGLDRVEDINASGHERIGYVPNTVRRGKRLSAASAFLKPALKRDNLTLELNTHVGWILFDGDRAAGVRVRNSNGEVRDIYAEKEIIISAGTVETPLLLERSGIGNAEVLSRIGVSVRVESPNVGEHAIEQRMINYQAKINKSIGYNKKLSSTMKQLMTGSKYLLNRKGVIASGAHDIAAFFKSDPSLDYADLIGMFNPLTTTFTPSGMKVSKEPGFSASGLLLHPTTESSVHSSSSEPDAPPIIDSRFLETEYDRKGIVKVFQAIREIAEQSPLADLIESESVPGANLQSTDDILNYALGSPHVFHAVGTSRMGSNDEDVVDSTLKVRGVRNLRVVDVSVLPIQPGNTMAPAIAIGWRAADIIRAEHGLQQSNAVKQPTYSK